MKNNYPRQCEDRWKHCLSPSINKNSWTIEEDKLLIEKVNEIGRKWVKISKFFYRRTDAQCKNRFKVLQRRATNLENLIQEFRQISNFSQSPDKNNNESNDFHLSDAETKNSELEECDFYVF
jgi:hypothetical protein